MLVNWEPWTPFCLSSGDARSVDVLLTAHDDAKDLARDVAFQNTDRFELGMSFSDATGYICFGPFIGPESTDGYDVQRAVRGAIASTVQAVADGLAR